MRYLYIILGCAAFIGLIKYWIPMVDRIILWIEKLWSKLFRS
ncbi:hypothetical protein N9K80_00905 [Flavobacteriaceae bacterium]|jgi:hypothetical protein|nr:hypothetical protein [Flavobacteriaceae bacterium]MDG2415803.1 hypothetical protein [Flavobacteriaceae bacterium]